MRIKTFFLSILVITVLISCKKDLPSEDLPDAGKLATAQFSIKMDGGVPTRQTSDVNANSLEQDVNSIHIIMFDEYGKFDNISFSVKEDIILDNGAHTVVISTTTGEKTIFVIVNANEDFALNPTNPTLDEFRAMEFNLKVDNTVDANVGGRFLMVGEKKETISDVEGKNGMQDVEVSVVRMAAKFSVASKSITTTLNFPVDMALITDVDLNSSNLKGQFVTKGMQFAILQENTRLLLGGLHRKLENPVPEDPDESIYSFNYDFVTPGGDPKVPLADEDDVAPKDGTFDHANVAGAINHWTSPFSVNEEDGSFEENIHFKPVGGLPDENGVGPINISTAYVNSVYSSENHNNFPLYGNVTYALLKIKYEPSLEITKDKGDFYTYTTGKDGVDGTFAIKTITLTPLTDGTFYGVYITNKKRWYIFDNKIAADAAQDDNPYRHSVFSPDEEDEITTSTEFTNGMCYYRIHIRNFDDIEESEDNASKTLKAKYSIRRNNYYKIIIRAITNLGTGDIKITNEVVRTAPTPLQVEGDISAEITIEDWNIIEIDEIL